MNINRFNIEGRKMVDFIADYMTTISSQPLTVQPFGHLKTTLPDSAPEEPEKWSTIMDDFVKAIMPRMIHCQHPGFYGSFPSGNSFPSILAEMFANSLGTICFSWQSNPASTELEVIVMDWLAEEIGLPKQFLSSSSEGGGVIQTSTSECILDVMLAARNQAIQHLKAAAEEKEEEEGAFVQKLVAYCSKEAHPSVQKAANILLIKLRLLDSDGDGSLRGSTLRNAMLEDKCNGLTPFFVCATLGSSAMGSFDNLEEMGQVCKNEPICWLHVDASYAGNALICSELQHVSKGFDCVDSFNIDTSQWMLVNFDCSCLWVRDKKALNSALSVNPLYLQHVNDNSAIDYRHWGIPLSRRFRSLKLWFVIRSYGFCGLRAYIRNHVGLAKHFENLVRSDSRFEIVNTVRLGLVCFRLKDCDNGGLCEMINRSGKVLLTVVEVKNMVSIRFCVSCEHAKREDMEDAWKIIQECADLLTISPSKDTINYLLNSVEDKTISL